MRRHHSEPHYIEARVLSIKFAKGAVLGLTGVAG